MATYPKLQKPSPYIKNISEELYSPHGTLSLLNDKGPKDTIVNHTCAAHMHTGVR